MTDRSHYDITIEGGFLLFYRFRKKTEKKSPQFFFGQGREIQDVKKLYFTP